MTRLLGRPCAAFDFSECGNFPRTRPAPGEARPRGMLTFQRARRRHRSVPMKRAYLPAALFLSLATVSAACSDDEANDGVAGGTNGTGAGASGEGGDGTGAGASAACPNGTAVDTTGLAFDGDADAVSMGVASELGLATFTVEAWVRRDGNGAAAGTGVGGLSLVPIAGKGRGESDGSNVDCNYQFGFFGDV